MAKIWFVKDGEEPTLGTFETEKTLRWCTDNLGLVAQDWEAPLRRPPHSRINMLGAGCAKIGPHSLIEVSKPERRTNEPR